MLQKIKQVVNQIILSLVLLSMQGMLFAASTVINLSDDNQDSLGAMASNMTAPLDFVEKAFNGMSVVLGVYMLISAVTRYKKYRENPQESPISFVIVWFLLGLLLIVLPFLHHLTFLASKNTGVTFVETN